MIRQQRIDRSLSLSKGDVFPHYPTLASFSKAVEGKCRICVVFYELLEREYDENLSKFPASQLFTALDNRGAANHMTMRH